MIESPNRLKQTREASGLTQAALGGMVGVTKQAISAFEAGETIPSLATAAAIARALGVTVDALFLGGGSTSLSDKTRSAAPVSASQAAIASDGTAPESPVGNRP